MTEKLQRSAIEPKNPLLNASRGSNLPHVPGIRVGDYIFLSGMTPVDPQTGERNHGPISDQLRTTLSNMQHMLESAGSSLERIVRVHIVLADISHMAEMEHDIANFSSTAGPHGLVDAAAVWWRLRDQMRSAGRVNGDRHQPVVMPLSPSILPPSRRSIISAPSAPIMIVAAIGIAGNDGPA